MSEDTFKTHYISKYGIAYSCNVHPERLQSDIQAINPDDYKRIRNNQTVYVITSALPHWFSVIYPKLKENKIRIFLVTGDSTVSAPLAIFNGNKVQFHHYMRDPRHIQCLVRALLLNYYPQVFAAVNIGNVLDNINILYHRLEKAWIAIALGKQ